MNPFSEFPTSKFEVISPEGEIRSEGEGIFTGKLVVVFNDQLQVFADDEIRRRLPNGSDEVFVVSNPVFMEKISSIPAHFQIHVSRKGTLPHHQGGHFNITVSGANARVNIGSTDNSTNIVGNNAVFKELINLVEKEVSGPAKEEIIDCVHEMESSQGKSSFGDAYKRFVGVAANHMTILAPLLPALTELL